MLRESSAQTNRPISLTTVADGAAEDIDAGPEIDALVSALTTVTDQAPTAARSALVAAAGESAAERTIAVCATFQMMNRLLDATGAPMPAGLERIASTLGFDPVDVYARE